MKLNIVSVDELHISCKSLHNAVNPWKIIPVEDGKAGHTQFLSELTSAWKISAKLAANTSATNYLLASFNRPLNPKHAHSVHQPTATTSSRMLLQVVQVRGRRNGRMSLQAQVGRVWRKIGLRAANKSEIWSPKSACSKLVFKSQNPFEGHSRLEFWALISIQKKL